MDYFAFKNLIFGPFCGKKGTIWSFGGRGGATHPPHPLATWAWRYPSKTHRFDQFCFDMLWILATFSIKKINRKKWKSQFSESDAHANLTNAIRILISLTQLGNKTPTCGITLDLPRALNHWLFKKINAWIEQLIGLGFPRHARNNKDMERTGSLTLFNIN